MGNAEAKALTATTNSISPSAVQYQHGELLSSRNRELMIDRAAFGLLFHVDAAGGIPYKLIDQLYDAAAAAVSPPNDAQDEGKPSEEAIPFTSLILALILAAPTIELENKLRMVFQAADPTAGAEELVLIDELRKRLIHLVIQCAVRLRGRQIRDGITVYDDRRCTACGELPKNAAFECRDCYTGHTILGLPVTVHLCGNCVGSWDGNGLTYEMRHVAKEHYCEQVRRAPNPHIATHIGVMCSGCGVTPIAGPRYQCRDCVDMIELCGECYATSESPFGHSSVHRFNVINQPHNLETEAANLVDALLKDCGLDRHHKHAENALVIHNAVVSGRMDGATVQAMSSPQDLRYVSESEFVGLAMNSERMTALLSGFDIRHLSLPKFPESIEVSETVEVSTV